MIAFDYREPSSLDEVIELLERHGDEAQLMAGGTAVTLMLKQQLISPQVLVGLGRSGIHDEIRTLADGWVEIGAMTKHRDIERSVTVAAYERGLAEAFGQIGTIRIRNQGTIGGNLAHADPAQDPAPVLLAMDAVVQVVGAPGSRSVPISSLFVDYYETSLGPSEIITAVRLPPRLPGSRLIYLKYLPRSQDDYATVGVAASAGSAGGRWSDVRVAIASAGPVPLRIRAAEAELEGADIDNDAVVRRAAELAAEEVDPITDLRGSADYKREMAFVWTRRALRLISAARDAEQLG